MFDAALKERCASTFEHCRRTGVRLGWHLTYTENEAIYRYLYADGTFREEILPQEWDGSVKGAPENRATYELGWWLAPSVPSDDPNGYGVKFDDLCHGEPMMGIDSTKSELLRLWVKEHAGRQ